MKTIAISEDRPVKVTIGFLIVIIGAIVTFALLINGLQNDSYANTKDVEEIKEDVKELDTVIKNIDNKLSVIEGYIKATTKQRR